MLVVLIVSSVTTDHHRRAAYYVNLLCKVAYLVLPLLFVSPVMLATSSTEQISVKSVPLLPDVLFVTKLQLFVHYA